jgi:hypothetical protein
MTVPHRHARREPQPDRCSSVCSGGASFGPFDSNQLSPLFVPGTIHVPDNGSAECSVKFNVHRIANP